MSDKWADWIRRRRSGGDSEVAARQLQEVAAFREKVLDRAELKPGETLLDVGCGNGLIGLGALERGAGVVIFTDVSAALLDDCRQVAKEAGLLERCRFIEAAAEGLDGIADASVDVVTTRSVLIFVKDKAAAFAEFHRALRPGGRISLFEPINRFGMEERRPTWGLDVTGEAAALMEKLNALHAELQPSDDPMLDFDERDLVVLAERTGFFPIRLEYSAHVKPAEPRKWEAFLHASFNPKLPTLAEAMDRVLTPQERERLVGELRPAVEEGRGVWRMGGAYLSAVKPG